MKHPIPDSDIRRQPRGFNMDDYAVKSAKQAREIEATRMRTIQRVESALGREIKAVPVGLYAAELAVQTEVTAQET